MNSKVPGDGGSLLQRLMSGQRNHPVPGDKQGPENAGVGHADITFCTMSCEHAEWPRDGVDGAKSCRTFNAVWCRALEQHTTRNAPCALVHGARRPKPNW